MEMRIWFRGVSDEGVEIATPYVMDRQLRDVKASTALIEVLLQAFKQMGVEQDRIIDFSADMEVLIRGLSCDPEEWFDELGRICGWQFGRKVRLVRKRGDLPDGSRLPHDLMWSDEDGEWNVAQFSDREQRWNWEEN